MSPPLLKQHQISTPYFISFYEKLLDEGRRMLHLHFDYLERTREGRLLTDEHEDMIEAIRNRDAARADQLAHAHTRQFSSNFISFLQANSSGSITLGPTRAL